MKQKADRKLISIFAAAVMLIMTGCGGQKNEENTEGYGGTEGGGSQAAMGRYMEREADLSGQMEEIAGIYRMYDGKLAITDGQGKFLVSEDNGTTWENIERQWVQDKAAGMYIMDAKMDPDGTMGMIYAEECAEGDDPLEAMPRSLLQCVLILPDDTVVPVEFPEQGNEDAIDRFWISDTGQYFVSTMEGNIYEVQKDGSSALYLMTEGSPQTIQFQGNLMVIDGYDFKAPLLYDMEKEAYVEDEVLAEFVQEAYGERGFNGAGWYNMCLFPGEEDVIYLAGRNGLHRHVIGGSVIEQVVDGRLSRLGNPQYGISGMVFLDEGEFLAASDHGKLIRFTYDPDREAVPRQRLKVYSLEKNSDMYSAVSFYQIHNPDVYVEYEVGMEEGEAVTKEDAIKKLNTKIIAGEGPDILVLDGLPVESYIDKGMLCSLNETVEDIGKEMLFENLFHAFQKGTEIYAIPGQVTLPVVMGEERYISGMAGLSDCADRIEQMRKDNLGADLIGLCSEKAVLKICAVIAAQEWRGPDGGIDRNAIAGFLVQAKRIYEAQMDGMEQERAQRLRQSNEENIKYAGEDWMYDLIHYGFYMDYAAGYSDTYIGVSSSPHNYMELASISKAKGFEDTVLMPMEGSGGCVFIPETILGISAAAQEKEMAADFLKMFLGKENQSSLSGYAVNRAAFDEILKQKGDEIGENEEPPKVGILYEDGRELSLELLPPTDDEAAAVHRWMETAELAYIEDTVFEKCVFEEGAAFILGEKELEETVDAIERRVAIYFAE